MGKQALEQIPHCKCRRGRELVASLLRDRHDSLVSWLAPSSSADLLTTRPLHGFQSTYTYLNSREGKVAVRGSPELHYKLPARLPGSFGMSGVGRVAEALTLTWFRFEVSLVWLILVPVILASPSEGVLAKLGLSVLSPIAALAIWVLLKLTGWVFYFVPALGRLWGWGRMIFLWAFSRLVVQPAPTIDLPAWGTR